MHSVSQTENEASNILLQDVILQKKKKISLKDFPGGPVVKNLPTYAGDSGSIPDWRTKTPHAAGQLSPIQPNT